MKVMVAVLCGVMGLTVTAAQRTMPEHGTKAPIVPSKQLTVTVPGGAKPMVFAVEDLAALPQVTIHVHNAHENKEETYTGPLVATVLAKAGLASTAETHKLILNSYAVAMCTDGYTVLYSLAELEPEFSSAKDIIALTRDGKADPDGIQLVNTSDVKPARWAHAITSLTVVQAGGARMVPAKSSE